MGMEEGLSFRPNICLYKQLFRAPPPSSGPKARGGSALFIWRGQVSLLLLGWPEWDGWPPWTLGALGVASAGSLRVQCLMGRVAALHSCLVDLGSASLAGLP